MRRRVSFAILFLIIVTCVPLVAAETDKEVQAHKVALDLAGAFSNESFKIRDGHWAGTINSKENAVIAVNLYAGNQYWFSVAAIDPAQKIDVAIYDETGKLVETKDYKDGARGAAGFSPTNSGQYFVLINLLEGNESTYCLVYSYK